MIFVGFIDVVFLFIYGLTAVLRLAPDVSLPSSITGSISTASGYISSLDAFFPVHELVIIFLVVFVAYEVAYFGYKLIMWVIRKIPGIS
jgi:hypothetical protein